MPATSTQPARVRGIVSCVPAKVFDNVADASAFEKEEVEKVVRMAGVKTRHVADETICASDLCLAAARELLQKVDWSPDTIDAVIMVTQSPDYLLPSTSCLIHRDLGLRTGCATFDVGLGCSGYPYGLWLASMMLQSPGFRRVLVLHGETPARFADHGDRAVALLFGDAGSATALEAGDDTSSARWWFDLSTDGTGWSDLLIRGGGFRDRFPASKSDCFVKMNGPNIFNFTIKRVPAMVEDTLQAAGFSKDQVDYYIFHQSNRFIMRHLAKKTGLPESRIPLTLDTFGSAGGPSIPLTITRGQLQRPESAPLWLLLLGYGVGLSWGSALIQLCPSAFLGHVEIDGPVVSSAGAAQPAAG